MPAAAIAAATSIGGSLLSTSGNNAAANAQKQASQQNLAFNNQVLGQVGSDVNPTIGYGNQAGSALSGLLGTGGNAAASQSAWNNYRNSTNYQFLLNQGLQGQSYLNAPNLYSGATGKALNNYAQGMAGNALQGYEGLLQNQQGLGLQGSQIYANAGTNIANLNQQATNLQAGVQGAADVRNANAYGSALSSLGGLGNQFGSSSFGGSPALNGSVMSSGLGGVSPIDTNVGALSAPIVF